MIPAAAPAAADAPVSSSLRTLAYERFRQNIMGGQLKAGQFVSQRELVDLLQVPLGAVREMIPRLEAGRLLLTVPKRGLQIAHVDMRLIRNAFQVRTMIEREAVQAYLRQVSEAELSQEESRHQAILDRALSGRPDPALDQDGLAVDWALHDRMVDSLGNEILSDIYRVNSMHVRMIRLEAPLVLPERVIPAMQEHLQFIGLLRARDAEGAVRAIEAHIDQSRQRVLSAMLRMG
ncbi:FCD domain-containing protein [Xylophilus rhododendri]|uniref:FCD domain-containing protein n=2 Tax=Xylophilus rhododendri TaxID=2697032 RepID=A0A857JCF2_9BURK|nr:FCD domain-containing protein [Xylophilus rhododendri]